VVLDGLIVGTSILFLGWVWVVGDRYRVATDGPLEKVIGLAYPVGDILILTVVLIVGVRARQRGLSVGYLCASLVSLAFADGLFALSLNASYEGILPDIGWFVGFLLLALAAARSRPLGPATEERPVGLAGLLLPYAALPPIVVLFASKALRGKPLDPVLVWVGAVIVVVVLVRQIGALAENARLSAEVGRRVDQLSRSNNDLEHFASLASHDLREPLRVVTAYLRLLDRRYAGRLDQDARDFIGHALDATSRMQRLVEGLLELSRIGAGPVPETYADSHHALEIALGNLGPRIELAGATVEAGPLPVVRGDFVQLVQLFQNLVGNAVKFRGEAAPHISVTASGGPEGWLFVVSDNGRGIAASEHERIFGIFERLDDDGHYRGTGIGLAVCRRIVERHGGRIWVESVPERGAAFAFTIGNRISLVHPAQAADVADPAGAAEAL
jgi:signal transduction histidine kinase